MTAEQQEKAEKYTSEQLRDVLEQLSVDQIRFIVARQEFATDKEAAEAVDIAPQTVYRWPAIVKEASRLMAVDGLVTAQHLRKRHVAKAMLVKTGGLDSDSEGIRQRVATEIIEGEMGKAAQTIKSEHSGEITTSVDPDQYDKALTFLAQALGGSLSGEGDEQDGEVDTSESTTG